MRAIYFTKEEQKNMINDLKSQFIETKNMKFEFFGNQLYASNLYDGLDMQKICDWLYEKYNIDVFRVKTVVYKTVFARSEQEAKDIINYVDRKHNVIEKVDRIKYKDARTSDIIDAY